METPRLPTIKQSGWSLLTPMNGLTFRTKVMSLLAATLGHSILTRLLYLQFMPFLTHFVRPTFLMMTNDLSVSVKVNWCILLINGSTGQLDGGGEGLLCLIRVSRMS